MKRGIARDRAFLMAVTLSTFFHLSMVTVFSIVIVFPREEIHYHSFRIVEPPRLMTGIRGPGGSGAAFGALPPGEALHLSGESDFWGALPDIELPTIEFAELRRFRIREKGLALRMQHISLLEPKPRDAWARFSEELGQIGSALTHFRLSHDRTDPANLEASVLMPATRPAAGFEAYIEWVGKPRERQLLFAPPIEALWGVEPESLENPIVLEFTVNAQGRVVGAWSPYVDETGIVTGAQKTVLKYRFEPLEDARMQQATLHICAARTRP